VEIPLVCSNGLPKNGDVRHFCLILNNANSLSLDELYQLYEERKTYAWQEKIDMKAAEALPRRI
jgi:hypothetical protein